MMKTIKEFINEMHNSKYNKEEYANDKNHKIYYDLANNYLDYVGKEQLVKCIDEAIKSTNNVFKILYDNHISEFINGQMIGRIIERQLAIAIGSKLNGCKFAQGKESSNEKDIECIEISDDFIKHMEQTCSPELFKKLKLDKQHSYGIELKTSSGSGIAGNKAYAADIDTEDEKSIKTGKNAFYILINYDFPVEIPITVNKQTSDDVVNLINKEFKITNYAANFGFIEQNDWIYGDKGGFAILQMPILREKRLINLHQKTKKEKSKKQS